MTIIIKTKQTWFNFCNSRDYVREFTVKLIKINYPFYLECPPITKNELYIKNLEFSFSKAEGLPERANYMPFKDYVERNQYVFWNLTNDTLLYIPLPYAYPTSNCANIYTFIPIAPLEVVVDFFYNFFQTLINYINGTDNKKPYGFQPTERGVPWLHLRICDRPKYYVNNQYTNQ